MYAKNLTPSYPKLVLFIIGNLLSVLTFAQITSPSADYTQPTQYTNGMPNDEIFVFCSPDVNGNQVTGSLTATPTLPGPGYSFEWGLYDENGHVYNTFATDNGTTSTVNGLASGGYSVTITNDAGQTETFITWVYVSIVDVSISLDLDPVNPGCEPFDVNGTIDASGFTYWDPVDPGSAPFIIDQNTTIEVCFNANHTYVSDLGFVLVGPPGCGSPGVTLSPNPQVINNANGCCCNSGNNLNNLCFNSNSTNQLNMCNSGTPLSGTYGFYNGTFPGNGGNNYPQGGIANLYGCNAAEGGWAVQIYDCIGADVGSLTGASITFSNGTSTIEYDSGPINSAINDNSCDPNSASIYVVPLTTPVEPDPQQVPNSGTLTYQLGLNGNPVSLAPGTNSFTETVDPPPGQDEWYYLAIQDQLGCAAIDSVMFDFTGYADATIDPINANNTVCQGNQTVQLTAATSGGTWSGTGVSPTGEFDPSAAGIGTHTITYTIPAPCGDVATIDITVGDLTISTATTASICTAQNGTATAAPLSGTAPFEHEWDTSPVQNTETATDLAPGDYEVTVSDAQGCSVTETVTVDADPGDLTASVSAHTDVLCEGACDGTATITPYDGTAPFNYLWDDGTLQTTQTAVGLCAGTFEVLVTDANGCEATDQVMISEPTALVPNAVMDTPSNCGNPDGEATASASGGTIANDYSYSWSTSPAQTTATATGLIPGTYSVAVTDDNGCSGTSTVDITSTTGFTASISTQENATCNSACDGTAIVDVSNGSTDPLTYSWNTLPVQTTATATDLCAGNYEATVTDAVGCVSTTDVTISEPPVVSTQLSSDVDTICIGETAQLSATASGGTPPYSGYVWSASASDASLDPSLQNPTVSPSETTEYTLVATDANNCSSMPKSITIEVLPPLSLDVIRPTSLDTGICPYDMATIDLQADGGDGNYSYFLQPDLTTPVQLPLDTQPNVTTTFDFTVTDGCTTPPADASSTITVFELPQVLFAADEPDGCEPHTVYFEDLTTPAPTSWNWNFGDPDSDQNTSTSRTTIHDYTVPGTYDVSLEVTSAEGCVNDTVFSSYINVYPLPLTDFEADPDTTTVVEGTVRFTDLSTGDPAAWNWSFGDGETDIEQNPQHTYSDTGTYTVWLSVQTVHGCEDETERVVVIEPEVMFYVPNAFSPNSDRRNDAFRGYGEGVDWSTYQMSIFDRWGEEIFFTNDINTPWDGSFKGQQVELGVYVYTIRFIDVKGEEHTYRGHVSVIR